MSMRTRCCAPVTGLRIGSPRPPVTPGATKRARRPATSTLESDGGEDRLMQFLERGGEHIEDGRPGLGILPGEDAQQRRPLRLARALVNHDRRFALALVDRARPAEDAYEPQPVQLGPAMLAVIDLEAADGLAMPVRRQSIELTGAAVGA